MKNSGRKKPQASPRSPRYIVDETGNKTEVILDIKTFEQLLEYVEDFYYSALAKEAMERDEFLDFEEVSKEILKNCFETSIARFFQFRKI